MSRIGRKPIAVPAGVDVKIDGHVVTVKGPKGTLTKSFHKDMIIKLEGNEIIVERPTEDKLHKSLHGLTRTLVSNMVEGVTHGFSKSRLQSSEAGQESRYEPRLFTPGHRS